MASPCLSIALLQELPHSLGVAADGVGFPLVVGPAGVCLVETGGLVIVKACEWERNCNILEEMELSEIGQEKSPVMRQEMQKGLRPFDWVYRCFRLATCLNTTNRHHSLWNLHFFQTWWCTPRWQGPPQWACGTDTLPAPAWSTHVHLLSDLAEEDKYKLDTFGWAHGWYRGECWDLQMPSAHARPAGRSCALFCNVLVEV